MPLAEIITHEGAITGNHRDSRRAYPKTKPSMIVVKDGAGFFVNRILAPYMNEAARLVLAGEPIEHVDKALVKFGFGPVGAALLDEVGIDVGAKVAAILRKLGERFEPPAAFDKLIDDERKGKKNQKVFINTVKG